MIRASGNLNTTVDAPLVLTDEVVENAGRAIHTAVWNRDRWEQIGPYSRRAYREQAKMALLASGLVEELIRSRSALREL